MRRAPSPRSIAVIISFGVLVTLSGCGGSSSAKVTVTPVPTSTSAPVASAPATPDSQASQLQPTNISASASSLVVGTSEGSFDKAVTPSGPNQITSQPTFASSFDKDGNGYYDYNEFQAALLAQIPQWEWPAHYQVSADFILSRLNVNRSIEQRWQVPYEISLTGNYNFCAWSHAWMDAYQAGDTNVQTDAIDHLKRYPTVMGTLQSDPDFLSHINDVIGQASLGNPAPLQQELGKGGTCGSVQFMTTGTPQAGD